MYFQGEHQKENPKSLWNKSFIFLNLSFFFVFSNIAFLYLYPLALDAMGNKYDVVGWVMGIFSIATVISRPFMGRLVFLKGEYRVISLGMALILVGSLGYNLISGFGPLMLLIRVIHGVGFSAFISGSFSLGAKVFHPAKQGEAFSIIGVSLLGAVAFAPPFGEFLIRWLGFHALYIAACGSVILSWITMFSATYTLSPPQKKDNKGCTRYMPLIKDRSFLFLLISTFIFAHCQSTVTNFFALIAAKKDMSIGYFFFASYFVAVIVLLTMGKKIDSYGKLVFLKIFYPSFAIGIFIIPGMIESPIYLVPALLYGVGIGLLFPAHNALAAGHGSEFEKPAVMSLFTAIYDTGFITGAIASGWLAHLASLDMLFFVTGILGFLGFFTVVVSPIKE